MKRIGRWTVAVLEGLLSLTVLVVGVIYTVTEYRFNTKYDLEPYRISIASTEGAIARGRHLDEAVLDCTFVAATDPAA